MKPLYEQYRPRTWAEVVGQEAVVSKLLALRDRTGLGGHAYWLSGQSGSGKTTIARLIAQEVAEPFSTDEIDASELTADFIRDCERRFASRPLGGKGWAVIVNEAHGLNAVQVRKLLVLIESMPSYVCFVFTTTNAGHEKLFADLDDAGPLLSRCIEHKLAQRGLCEAFAVRAREIAQAAGLDGQPIERYQRLLKDCRNNLRMALMAIENGDMLEG